MIDFYEATGGDNWHRNEGWLTPDSDPCDWEGVQCFGRLNTDTFGVNLRLEKNSLMGLIPDSVSRVSSLRTLVLNGNQLQGDVPAALINDMPSLQVLDLSDNRLSGAFPEFMADPSASRLDTLNLSRNRFDGEPPPSWSKLPWLENLDLSGNRLIGPIPGDWKDLGTSRQGRCLSLRLSDNRFTGPLPSVLADMSHLCELDLAGNDFSGPLPAWLGQLELNGLFLQRNRLSGPIDLAVQAVDKDAFGVVRLMLADNLFSGPIPESLMALPFRRTSEISNDEYMLDHRPDLLGLDLCWNDFELPNGELLEFLNLHNEGADVRSCLGAARRELDPTISGSWFDPERPGEGFAQQLLPGGNMFVYWFSYSPRPEEAGSQFWAFEAVRPGDNHARFGPVYAPEGGRFSQGLGNRSVEFDRLNIGRIFIDRVGDAAQKVRYSQLEGFECLGFICAGRSWFRLYTGTFHQTRLTRLAGTTCENQQPHQEISAIWLSPHSNEGFVVEVTEDGRGVVYWFTFEPNDSGRQA